MRRSTSCSRSSRAPAWERCSSSSAAGALPPLPPGRRGSPPEAPSGAPRRSPTTWATSTASRAARRSSRSRTRGRRPGPPDGSTLPGRARDRRPPRYDRRSRGRERHRHDRRAKHRSVHALRPRDGLLDRREGERRSGAAPPARGARARALLVPLPRRDRLDARAPAAARGRSGGDRGLPRAKTTCAASSDSPSTETLTAPLTPGVGEIAADEQAAIDRTTRSRLYEYS